MLLEINPVSPEPRKIRRVVDALERGDIITYPTDTVYGLGCDLFNKRAVERLYQIKGLPKSHQLAFVCNDLSEVSRYAVLHNWEYRILKQYLPGPYCFIVPATREVPKIVQTNRKQVGVRIPDHAIARELVRELGRPIISSTAAKPGETPHVDPQEILAEFKGVDLGIDGGPGGIEPTTVVDLTSGEPVVVREGAGDSSAFQ